GALPGGKSSWTDSELGAGRLVPACPRLRGRRRKSGRGPIPGGPPAARVAQSVGRRLSARRARTHSPGHGRTAPNPGGVATGRLPLRNNARYAFFLELQRRLGRPPAPLLASGLSKAGVPNGT